MGGRSPADLLIYESKRRPEIRALLDLAETGELTDEQLDAAKVPLPWYRKALRDLRNARLENRRINVSMANTLRAMEGHGFIRDGRLAPSEGVMMTYVGPTQFIAVGNGHIELQTDRPVFFPKIGGVWIDTAFSRRIDKALEACVIRPVECNRLYYIQTWKAILAGVAEGRNDIQQIGEDAALGAANTSRAPTHLAKLGVRFG